MIVNIPTKNIDNQENTVPTTNLPSCQYHIRITDCNCFHMVPQKIFKFAEGRVAINRPNTQEERIHMFPDDVRSRSAGNTRGNKPTTPLFHLRILSEISKRKTR